MKRSFRMITLKQILPQICPGDWFMLLDLKDAYFHIQVAHLSQTILEIRIQRGGISIQGPAVWAIPGSPHFYTMHGCGSLPSATDGNPHTQLPRRLAHSGPVPVCFNSAQDPPPQPLRLPGAQGQLCQEHTVTQSTCFVPGHSYWLNADDNNCLSGASHDDSAPHGLLKGRCRPSAQRECWALWQWLRRYFSWVCFTCDPSSSGWAPTPPPHWMLYGVGRACSEGGGGGVMSDFVSLCLVFPCPYLVFLSSLVH